MKTSHETKKRAKGFRLGFSDDQGNFITLSTASAILKELTGRRKSCKVLAEIMHQRPHLALFDHNGECGRPRFLAVRRDRWIYFIKTRALLDGARHIFHENGLD